MKDLLIKKNNTIIEALKKIGKSAEKNLIVVDNKNKLLGILSDGDLRRAILRKKKLTDKIDKIYNKKSFYLYEKKLIIEDLKKQFIEKKIFFVPVVDDQKKIKDILTWDKVFSKKNPVKIYKRNIPVVIMAGGRGTRLEPFTKVLPKPLIPIEDKTVIEHIIDSFTKYGSKNFFISLNYKSKILKSFFEELNPPYSIKYLEENSPLGTAGALHLLKNKMKRDFYVTNSDIILKIDHTDLYDFHAKNKNDITIVVVAKEYEIPYGTCEINSNGRLSSIKEKPKFNFLINSGLYLFNYKILNHIKENKKLDMNELIQTLIKKGKKIKIFPVPEKMWTDVGQWVEYKKIVDKLN